MEYSFRDRKGLYSFTMLMVLFVLMFVCLIISEAIVKLTLPVFFGITDAEAFITSSAEQLRHPLALIYFQAMCSSIGFFLLPVIMYHLIFRYDIVSIMGLKAIPSARFWFIAIGIMAMSAIFTQWLVQVNMAIPLSGTWAQLRTMQEQVDKIMDAFFSENSISRLLLLTLVIAALPAVAEELCFRGTIQNTLAQTNLGPVGAIIITGLTFSLVHFEFDNFLAIWCMGAVLGFIYYYSGSIWVSIMAHFLNNFAIIIGKYAYMKGLVHFDMSSSGALPLYLTLPAGAVMIGGLVVMRKWSGKYTDGIIN
jgi:membrane protease YdiL (CAAX protease family)